jgi:hypothetical protein
MPYTPCAPLHELDSDPRDYLPDEGDDLDAADPVDTFDEHDNYDDPVVDFLYDPPSLNR